MNFDYDVAVIGAGTAGLAAADVTASMGARVALIERDKIGGDALWRGSVPSQTLLRSAKVWDLIKRSEEFGIHVEKPRLVWSAVRLRISDVRDELRRLHRETLAASGVTQTAGIATFLDEHTLEVKCAAETRRITSDRFVVATGSSPLIPPIDGLTEASFLSYEALFERPNLPKSLIFIGGGALACEMAQAFNRFGTRVVLLQSAAQLVPHEEPEIAAYLLRILRAEGVEVHVGAVVSRVEKEGERKRVVFSVSGEETVVEAGEVVVVAGRKPRFDGFDLERAGVQIGEEGIMVDERLRTTASHIWACGSCTGEPHFTHASEHAGKVAGANAVRPDAVKEEWKTLSSVTFTDPEIAHIGLSPAEASREWGEIETHRADFKTLDRAVIEGEAGGFALVFTTKAGQVVGAQIIGAGAGELAAVAVAAIRDGTLLQEWAATIFAYPTMSGIFHRVGEEGTRKG